MEQRLIGRQLCAGSPVLSGPIPSDQVVKMEANDTNTPLRENKYQSKLRVKRCGGDGTANRGLGRHVAVLLSRTEHQSSIIVRHVAFAITLHDKSAGVSYKPEQSLEVPCQCARLACLQRLSHELPAGQVTYCLLFVP